MKWLIIAIIVFAQQPAKTSEYKRTAESNRAESTRQAEDVQNNQTQTAQPTPSTPQPHITSETQRNAAIANDHAQHAKQASDEDRATQREITWFTGVLAGVGILQLIVMFLTWLVYRRQAHEMRRQRHEMQRQRHVMLRQWMSMGEQAELMRSQLAEIQKQGGLVDKQATEIERQRVAMESQLAVMRGQAALMEDQMQHLISTERAWLMDTLVWASPGLGLVKHTNSSGHVSASTQIHLFWNNHGKTPAWITEVRIKMEVVESLPEEPDITFANILNGPYVVIPENLPHRDGHTFFLESDTYSDPDNRSIAVIYGVIKYRDTFTPKDETRETWFGYRVGTDGGTERLTSARYNRNT